ncbi:MAG: hypothetical protein V3U57_01190 [Robiginitomaculum sp.]
MNKISILKSGLIASACVVSLTLTACASRGQNHNSRYGSSAYDYESGGNCGVSPCDTEIVVAPVAKPSYSPAPVISRQQVSPAVVYADCSVVSGVNCNTQPAPTYQAMQSSSAPVTCPAGTTSNGHSCMENSSAYTVSTLAYSGGPVSCPVGTTDNGDGTCMESSGYNTGSTYTNTLSSVACPSGTTPNSNGSCMSTGYVPTYSNPTNYMPIRK